MKEVILQLKKDPTNGKWGIFFGWDPELVPDLPILSASYLDKEFSDVIPVFVYGQSSHIAWANTPALQKAGVSISKISNGDQ